MSLLERPSTPFIALAVFMTAPAACERAPDPVKAVDCAVPSGTIGTFVSVPSGQFQKGAHAAYAEERPEFAVHVQGFSIQTHEVTNDQFAAFVEETGFETDAERSARLGGPAAGSAVFRQSLSQDDRGGTWSLIPGATWRAPLGPDSNIDGRGAHPVVHVSHRDALAYASWAGGRLPNEVEWEYAAHLGLADPSRPESGAYDEVGRPIANTWQGIFPLDDLGEDGAVGLAPIGCYVPSAIGLYDMIGNAWEWTATPYAEGTHTLKGGSFLCSDNFCRRYRPAARQPQESDFSSNHIGFRIVKDLEAS